MFLQKGAGGLNVSSVQMAQGNGGQQGGTLSMQGQVVSAGSLQNSIQQQHAVQPPSQQQTLLREQNTALSQVRQAKRFSFCLSLTRWINSLAVFVIDFSIQHAYVKDSGFVYFSLRGRHTRCSLNRIHCLHLSTTRWWSLSKVLLTWFKLPQAWRRILDPTLLLWQHLHRTVRLRLGVNLHLNLFVIFLHNENVIK